MRPALRCLKRWIAWWQSRGANGRLTRVFAAALTAPVVLLAYLFLRICARFRGPIRIDGQIIGGATLMCWLPDVVQWYVFLFGLWEPDITSFVLQRLGPGDTFVDVGAHAGYYTLLASTRVGDAGHVVAIEASPTIFRQLRLNLRKNHAANVRALNVAATAEEGVRKVHRGPVWNLGWTTTRSGGALPLECEVPAQPLDNLLTADERRSARLIKIDVEGTERELIAGLVNILREGRPDLEVILELSPRWWTPPESVENALQPLFDQGLHAYRIDNDYSPWRYLWGHSVRPPRRARGPITSWIGQVDVVLSRRDQETL